MQIKAILKIIILCVGVCNILLIPELKAQETIYPDSAALMNMSLEELMNLKGTKLPTELEKVLNSFIEVASKKPLSSRKTPSIISLITRDEIEKSGARDLIDVLRLVPGIDFGLDVWGTIGIGMRGNWAHEGKVLVLLDGQEMNETLYSSTQFGNHFPISLIKKIEVIRGPGSAIYGGYSEYGVINIITRDGEDINGVSVGGVYGQMSNDYARRNAHFAIGQKIKDFNYSFSGFVGQGQRSGQEYTDPDGNSVSMLDNANINPQMFNLGMSFKGLSLKLLSDDYKNTVRVLTGLIDDNTVSNNFISRFAELKYDWKISKALTITPKFNYKTQKPWQSIDGYPDSLSDNYYTNTKAERTRANITASYDFLKIFNVIAGAEGFTDKATLGENTSDTFLDGSNTVSYINAAGFIQALAKFHYSSITLGARYEYNNSFGSAFVPRLGITKRFNKFNFKLLFSSAFRAPNIYNVQISYNGEIKPEKSSVIELETSYQIDKTNVFSVNIFDINTKQSILYFVDLYGNEGYKNAGRGGTNGIESEFKHKASDYSLVFGYSFYTSMFKNIVPDYEVPDVTGSLLAFANHKVTLNGTYNITKDLSANISTIFLSKRYGYEEYDTSGTQLISEFAPTLLLNTFINYNNLAIKGLSLGLGCYDILGTNLRYIQPYAGGHPSIPGNGREIVVKLNYDLNFRKK